MKLVSNYSFTYQRNKKEMASSPSPPLPGKPYSLYRDAEPTVFSFGNDLKGLVEQQNQTVSPRASDISVGGYGDGDGDGILLDRNRLSLARLTFFLLCKWEI